MSNLPKPPLPYPVQLAITATNLPFRALSYIFTPFINSIRSTNHLVHQICRQNWVFLCISYLHLWQLFKSSPPIRPLAHHWPRIVTALLFLTSTTPAILILHAAIPLFSGYWTDHQPKKEAEMIHRTALFTLICAPICAVLGVIISAIHFLLKRQKYGKYRASMRRLGNGYWADPRDLMDWQRVKSRQEAVEKLQAWEGAERETFVVERVCVDCGSVKEGVSARCVACGGYGERGVVRGSEGSMG